MSCNHQHMCRDNMDQVQVGVANRHMNLTEGN